MSIAKSIRAHMILAASFLFCFGVFLGKHMTIRPVVHITAPALRDVPADSSSAAYDLQALAEAGDVPGGWVEVANLDSVESGNNSFGVCKSCILNADQSVTLLVVDGDSLLFRYNKSQPSYGTECPGGIIFWMSKAEYAERVWRVEAVQTAEHHLRAKTARALKLSGGKIR